MVEVTLKKGFKRKVLPLKVVFYSSAHDMPMSNYEEFQKLSMIDINVGSNIDDFNQHFSKLHAYLKNNKVKEALLEMNNLYQGYWNQINNISIYSYCLVPFIQSIGGEEYKIGDLDKCNETIAMLSKAGLTNGKCEEVLTEVKKKLLSSWSPVFLANSISQDNPMFTSI